MQPENVIYVNTEKSAREARDAPYSLLQRAFQAIRPERLGPIRESSPGAPIERLGSKEQFLRTTRNADSRQRVYNDVEG